LLWTIQFGGSDGVSQPISNGTKSKTELPNSLGFNDSAFSRMHISQPHLPQEVMYINHNGSSITMDPPRKGRGKLSLIKSLLYNLLYQQILGVMDIINALPTSPQHATFLGILTLRLLIGNNGDPSACFLSSGAHSAVSQMNQKYKRVIGSASYL
jgi:hypothetical protein